MPHRPQIHSYLVILALLCTLPAVARSVWAAPHNTKLTVSRPATTHIALGPSVTVARLSGLYDSEVGGDLHLVLLRPERFWATLGVALEVSRFSKNDTTRVAVDFYSGLALSSDFTLGIAVAPIADLRRTERTAVGLRVSAWLHAGVAPFLSISKRWGQDVGDYIDISAGIRIPFSIAILSTHRSRDGGGMNAATQYSSRR